MTKHFCNIACPGSATLQKHTYPQKKLEKKEEEKFERFHTFIVCCWNKKCMIRAV